MHVMLFMGTTGMRWSLMLLVGEDGVHSLGCVGKGEVQWCE